MNRRVAKRKSESVIELLKNKLNRPQLQARYQQAKSQLARLPKLHQRIIAGLSVGILALMLWPSPTPEAETAQAPEPINGERKSVELNTASLSEQHNQSVVAPKSDLWQEYIVKSGDTLAQVFRANDLPMADLNALAKIEGSDKPLSRIKQGQLVRFKRNAEGELDILQLEKSGDAVMFFRLSDGGFGRSK